MLSRRYLIIVALFMLTSTAWGAEQNDRQLAEYLRGQTRLISDACLADIHSRADWEAKRPELKRQLLEMLGLDPLPERTELHATVTGRVERDEIVVEKIHFQSRPNLYVTGNLYLPKNIDQPVPAILYLCGHGGVKLDGVSYGNKVHYQHHGAWFARHGYACLTIDSLQLGEIEGLHHGTHNLDMWWWVCRGYTPAGVEAWNCVRALDYLETRPEIDAKRIGATGRSGGGAYSWWIAAIDDRVAATVPVAGITDLQNHVVDGCVDGHCDCMYMVNTYRWDYPAVAALVAPRPLLISNTDRDGIFPLDGVVRTHRNVRHIYDDIYEQPGSLALNICAGPHQDTQELQINAFRWMNHHLKSDDSLLEKAAVRLFTPQELKVFDQLPSDSINADIAETFVAAASPLSVPSDAQAWSECKKCWMNQLEQKAFRAWPQNVSAQLQLVARTSDAEEYALTTQPAVRIPLLIRADQPMNNTMDDESVVIELAIGKQAVVYPRGIGRAGWSGNKERQNQIARRFYLLGQSIEGMQVWDVRQAIAALRAQGHNELRLHAQGRLAGVALYASLFEPGIAELHLHKPPHSHREGPIFLNVLRFMDMPRAMALAAERTRVVVYDQRPESWQTVVAVRDKLGWPANHFELRALHDHSESSAPEPTTP